MRDHVTLPGDPRWHHLRDSPDLDQAWSEECAEETDRPPLMGVLLIGAALFYGTLGIWAGGKAIANAAAAVEELENGGERR